MEYELKTNRGVVFNITSENFNPSDYIKSLNRQDLLMIPLGDIVTQKHNIQSISPKRVEGETPEGEKLDILTNQEEIMNAYVDEYDVNTLSTAFNDPQMNFVLIGDVIINRRNANMIMPAKEEA